MKLEEAIALVTGGARGLGLAVANALHENGCKVEIADRDPVELSNLPPYLSGTQCDVSNVEEVRSWVHSVQAKHGRVDILVNNAGLIHSEPLINIMSPDAMGHDVGRFRTVVESNLVTTFVTTSVVAELMVRMRTQGVIVNVSSISYLGNEGQTAYSAAKAGINAMTVTWSKELGRFGIRCNAIAPGFIDTPSTRAALSDATLQQLKTVIPCRRLGEAAHIAEGVLSLVENDYINGVVLEVNGGMRL